MGIKIIYKTYDPNTLGVKETNQLWI